MIRNFFRGLNSSNVEYMIISGQATVFYGAATFSEDIDLWVKPELKNWNRLLKFLRKINAKIYKLTPPITMKYIQKGHAFHFELHSKKEKPSTWFLDALGSPPRVRTFNEAWKSVVIMKTDWGSLPVVGLRDLVEIKKTRRLEDYPIISNLVHIEYEKNSRKKINRWDWKWLLNNSFEVMDILLFIESDREAQRVGGVLSRPCLFYCLKTIKEDLKREKHIDSASKKIALEIEEFRSKDRRYWKPIIKELKELRQKNKLLHSGTAV